MSEGAGLLLLERLSDAQANGHSVLALVRGSAVNQDGASNGLAAPNGPSQERVIRQALANAGLEPADVDVVEAHGTGTPLGDPIEAGAVLATYGRDRERPLGLGSVKSNIAHAAAAAGVVGVIKTVMAMRAGVRPKTLHAARPSAMIDWSSGAVELLAEESPWEVDGRPRRAGVSSFGVSGTNAHLILEEAPAPEPEGGEATPPWRPPAGPVPLLVSAKSDAALREACAGLAAHLEAHPDLEPLDIGGSLAGRPAFENRAAILASDRRQLAERLSALANGGHPTGTWLGQTGRGARPAFLFPGYGSQWPGMTVELLDSSATFAEEMRRCDEALGDHVEWSVEEVLRDDDGGQSLDRADVGSLTLFATMVALAKLWQACGVEPGAVAGHSQGEVVAAHVAGALSLEDAARVAALRNRALMRLVGDGAMAAVAQPAVELEPHLDREGGALAIAAVNGPSATVVSGPVEQLEDFVAECRERGAKAKMIPGAEAASHSAQIEVLREELLDSLASIAPRSGSVPFYSTVTGDLLDTAKLDAEYWYRNLRQTVLLEPVVRRLIGRGYRVLLEVSPHPVLGLGLQETVEASDAGQRTAILGTLRRDEGGAERFAESLAEAVAAGVEVEWRSFFAAAGGRAVRLPTYPFQRKRYWLEASTGVGDVSAAGLADGGHPMLGARIDLPGEDGVQLSGRLSPATHRWLNDHALLGVGVVLPALFLELALHAAGAVGAGEIEELELREPLVLPGSSSIQLRVAVGAPDEQGRREITVLSRPEPAAEVFDAEEWALNAKGVLSSGSEAAEEVPPVLSGPWPPEGADAVNVERLYDSLADAGFEYGPAFHGISAVWRRDEEFLATVSLGGEPEGEAPRFGLHPVLLDAITEAGSALISGGDGAAELGLASSWRNVRLHRSGVAGVRVRIESRDGHLAVIAAGEDGSPVFSIGSVATRALDSRQARMARRRRSLYRVEWDHLERPTLESPGHLAVIGEVDVPGLEAERFGGLEELVEAASAGVLPDLVLAAAPQASGDALPAAAHTATRQALELAQAWLAAPALSDARLALITEGAVAVGDEDPDLRAAPLWGLLRSAQSEHAGRFALLDLDGAASSWEALSLALAISGDEPSLAIREGRLLAPRMARAAIDGAAEATPIDPATTVLITGGTSGVGAAVARHLVREHGVGHLLLVSRRGPQAEGAAELAAELEGFGAEVRVAACDVADREQLEGLLDSVPAEHPLGAIVHSAAVLDNGLLASLDAERLERVMRPKVDGAWNLHELTAGAGLSQFLLFSSAAGVIGTAVQANYAAANVFLDALAAHRHAHGLPATSMAWGGWAQESSLAGELSAADRARIQRLGIAVMTPEQSLELFDAAREVKESRLVPVGLESAALRAQAEAGMLPPVLRGLIRARVSRDQSPDAVRARLARLSGEEKETAVLELVRAQAATVLGCDSSAEVSPDRVLQEMGLDSLGALELRNGLIATTGLSLPILTLTDSPTPAGIARHLAAQVPGPAGEATGGVGPSGQEGSGKTTLVSLLGEARRDGTLDAFMELLAAASAFRAAFEDPDEETESGRAIQLADGHQGPPLVMIPSVGAMSGPHEYVRFAREFNGERRVQALRLPGFGADELLPADLGALTRALARQIAGLDLNGPVALAGHSSGGWIVHALVAHLESIGQSPAAAILLDTYAPDSTFLAEMVPAILAAADDSARAGVGLDDTRLTAMGGYRRILSSWRPEKVSTPVLMVRASSVTAEHSADDGVTWGTSIEGLEVPGDHFSMMNDHADSTAEAVRQSLESIISAAQT